MENHEALNQGSYDLDQQMQAKEKEFQAALKVLYEYEQEFLLLGRQIIGLQGKKKDVEIQIIGLQGKKKDVEIIKSKATQNVRVLASEIKLLRHAYFTQKVVGL